MNIQLDRNLSEKYNSKSQRVRVITENWMFRNMYCPRCGFARIEQFENNKPVADFFCSNCDNEWDEMRKKHYNGEITDDELRDWKLSYPYRSRFLRRK